MLRPKAEQSRLLSKAAGDPGDLSAERFAAAVEDRVRQAMYELAYGLSHEINNPLANISARAEQFARMATDDSQRRSAETIIRQCRRAHEMLGEMMLAVRPSRQIWERIDLRDFAESQIPAWQRQCDAYQLAISADIDVRPLPIRADRNSLQQTLQALIDNAIGASSPGQTIYIRCHRTDEPLPAPKRSTEGIDELMPSVRWAVIDNGIGMTAEQILRAFDMYYCGRENGRFLGLGLSRVRRTVDQMGGVAWLESSPGCGTAAEIRVPLINCR